MKRYSKKQSILIAAFCISGAVFIETEAHALESVKFAIGQICQHMEGSLGGLLMVAAGVGGMISAAFGNMKALYSCIITGIGAFSISTMLSLYPQFSEAYSACTAGRGFDGFQGDINPGAGAGLARTARGGHGFENFEPARVTGFDEVAAINQFLRSTRGEPGQEAVEPRDKSVGMVFGDESVMDDEDIFSRSYEAEESESDVDLF